MGAEKLLLTVAEIRGSDEYSDRMHRSCDRFIRVEASRLLGNKLLTLASF